MPRSLFIALLLLGTFPFGCKKSTPAAADAAGAAAPPAAAPSAAAVAAVESLQFDDAASVKAVVALSDEARPLLRAHLETGDVVAVKNALAAYAASLGRLPPLDLVVAMERDDPVIRRLALQTAGDLAQGEIFGAVRARLADPDLEVQREATRALVRFDDPRGQETLLPLLEKVSGKERALGDAAAEALGKAVGPIAPVVALLAHPNPIVRQRALSALAGRGIPETIDDVAKVVADADPAVRQAALETLARFGSRQALSKVEPLASSTTVEDRRLAVRLFQHFDPTAVRAPLWKALTDSDPLVRQLATTQLGRYDGNRTLLEALPRMLTDDAATVRSAAVSVAQGLHRTPLVDKMLLDRIPLETDPKVFRVLGRAYRARGVDGAAFRALVAALGEARGIAADGIGEALHTMTGQSFGTDAWAWRNWAAQRVEAHGQAIDAGSQAGAADAGATAPPSDPPDAGATP